MVIHRIDRVYAIRRKGSNEIAAGPFALLSTLDRHIMNALRGHMAWCVYRNVDDFEVVTFKCEEENVVSLAFYKEVHKEIRGRV